MNKELNTLNSQDKTYIILLYSPKIKTKYNISFTTFIKENTFSSFHIIKYKNRL